LGAIQDKKVNRRSTPFAALPASHCQDTGAVDAETCTSEDCDQWIKDVGGEPSRLLIHGHGTILPILDTTVREFELE
jgi:hypothetical protein